MEQIDPDALYDARGTVPWTRPIIQGDVFSGVTLPGFGEAPTLVQIVAHPCAIRRGTDLLPRITVAPLARHKQVLGAGAEGWDGHLKFMPMPNLLSDGKHYATQFVDITAAPSEMLTLGNRIASLTNRGIYVLQQRLIKHYTRLEVDISTLRVQSSPVLEEAEQERDWIETVLGGEPDDIDAVTRESVAFDAWMREGDPSRRVMLGSEANHRDLRRQTHAAAASRASVLSEDGVELAGN